MERCIARLVQPNVKINKEHEEVHLIPRVEPGDYDVILEVKCTFVQGYVDDVLMLQLLSLVLASMDAQMEATEQLQIELSPLPPGGSLKEQ